MAGFCVNSDECRDNLCNNAGNVHNNNVDFIVCSASNVVSSMHNVVSNTRINDNVKQ
jgi:hypothetical protein